MKGLVETPLEKLVNEDLSEKEYRIHEEPDKIVIVAKGETPRETHAAKAEFHAQSGLLLFDEEKQPYRTAQWGSFAFRTYDVFPQAPRSYAAAVGNALSRRYESEWDSMQRAVSGADSEVIRQFESHLRELDKTTDETAQMNKRREYATGKCPESSPRSRSEDPYATINLFAQWYRNHLMEDGYGEKVRAGLQNEKTAKANYLSALERELEERDFVKKEVLTM